MQVEINQDALDKRGGAGMYTVILAVVVNAKSRKAAERVADAACRYNVADERDGEVVNHDVIAVARL